MHRGGERETLRRPSRVDDSSFHHAVFTYISLISHTVKRNAHCITRVLCSKYGCRYGERLPFYRGCNGDGRQNEDARVDTQKTFLVKQTEAHVVWNQCDQ